MSKYANDQEYREKAPNPIGIGLEKGLEEYRAIKERESVERTLNDPNATPIQKALAASKIDPKLSATILKQSTLEQEQARIAQKYGNMGQQVQGEIPRQIPNSSQLQEQIMQLQNYQPGQHQNPQQLQQQQIPQQNVLPAIQQQPQISPGEILETSVINPQLGRTLADVAKMQQKTDQYKQEAFLKERDWQTKQGEKFAADISGLRKSLPLKEAALRQARTALESENLGMFSKDYLADITGIPALRTASGAALNLAVKENLFSNLSRVSAKAQNLWLEKVMAGAFPQKGQTKQANLMVQEALEAEMKLDQAKMEIYNQLAEQDRQRQGYVQGDTIEQRTYNALEPIEKDILDRTTYRSRVLYENEKGTKKLQELANKKAPQGTPLTRTMFQVFLQKTGSPEEAIKRAKQLGYIIYNNDKVQEYTSP